jgi:hypothetical protein
MLATSAGQRDGVDGITTGQQGPHCVKDVLVTRLVKMFNVNACFRNGVHCFA